MHEKFAFASIIALVCVWLVCKFCENLALRVWGFIAIILGLIFVLGADGDFWQFIFLLVIFFARHCFARLCGDAYCCPACCCPACVGCGFGYFALRL